MPRLSKSSGRQAHLNGARYSADDEITVVASASEGLYASISALVHPGDEVIYFEPTFDSYAPIVRLQGATSHVSPRLRAAPTS
jgi:aspartate/methionine/tyrosine aminotransferase